MKKGPSTVEKHRRLFWRRMEDAGRSFDRHPHDRRAVMTFATLITATPLVGLIGPGSLVPGSRFWRTRVAAAWP